MLWQTILLLIGSIIFLIGLAVVLSVTNAWRWWVVIIYIALIFILAALIYLAHITNFFINWGGVIYSISVSDDYLIF